MTIILGSLKSITLINILSQMGCKVFQCLMYCVQGFIKYLHVASTDIGQLMKV